MSAVMDAQREVTWQSISWDETVPSGTDVEFQVAVSDSPDGPWSYVGPNGHWSTRFSTAAGQALPTLFGRYFRYKAFLNSDGFATPSFGGVQISFSGLQTSSVTTYEYDAAGNRTRKIVETDAGVVLEEVLDDPGWSSGDRINTLNQVMRRDVTDVGGTTSWEFTWDADGQLTSKTDGTDTFTYTWNDEGRLERVEGPGGLDVSFEYDSIGRLLRRVSGSDETLFEWDRWDLVRESASDGTVTRYFCSQGEILRFQRGIDFYSVHSDALGSVRMITDSAGRVVSEFQYDAWGNVLASSADGFNGGFAYKFVGSLGCRADDEVGLIYLRNRWFDQASLARFLSRESANPAIRQNHYTYCDNNPIMAIDPFGTRSCAEIEDAMARRRKKIIERIDELNKNTGPSCGPGKDIPLPYDKPGHPPMAETVMGHLLLLEEEYLNYAKEIAEWFQNGCGPLPPWAFGAVPKLIPNIISGDPTAPDKIYLPQPFWDPDTRSLKPILKPLDCPSCKQSSSNWRVLLMIIILLSPIKLPAPIAIPLKAA